MSCPSARTLVLLVLVLILVVVPLSAVAGGKGQAKGKGKGKGKSASHGDAGQGGRGSAKVTICHVPPGNPENAKTMTLPESALAAHFGHGDMEGECDDERLIRICYRQRRLSEIEEQRRRLLEQAERERDEAFERARREAAGGPVRDSVREGIQALFDEAERRALGAYDENRHRILAGEEDAVALLEAAEAAERAVAEVGDGDR